MQLLDKGKVYVSRETLDMYGEEFLKSLNKTPRIIRERVEGEVSEVICVGRHTCEHKEVCAGATPHQREGCKCGECPQSSHAVIIKDPPKLAWPCHYGQPCSCGGSGKH